MRLSPGDLVRKISNEHEWLRIDPWDETSAGIVFWRENAPALVLEVYDGSNEPFSQIKVLTKAGAGWLYASKVELVNSHKGDN